MGACETCAGNERIAKLHGLKIDRPWDGTLLEEYDQWWHTEAVPDMLARTQVQAIPMDGHEKVIAKCADNPPARSGRPRKDGHIKMSHSGWFMVTDKATGVVLGVAEMLKPENNDVALMCLARALDMYENVDCVIYDRMCSLLPTITKKGQHQQVGYWCIDKFHAKGHCGNCRCSPLNHPRLQRRLAKVNTYISEQVFPWFRVFAATMNMMTASTHRFTVLVYVRRHNALILENQATYLNPFSAHRKTMKKAQIHRRPASHAYTRKKHILKKPARKRPSTRTR